MSSLQLGNFIATGEPVLGAGVNSVVHPMVNHRTGAQAVGKLIDFTLHPGGKSLYTKELECLTKLKACPHIIPLLAHTQNDSRGLFVLPRIQGDLLDSLFEFPQHRFSENLSRKVFKQLVHALKHCHDNGIAHMDIKPENIFLSNDHTLFLGDFGSSHNTAIQGEWTKGNLGTPLYCAPEQFSSQSNLYRPLDADLWSIGVVLFAMTTGSWPYKSSDYDQLTSGTPLNGKFHLVDSKQFGISPALRDLLSKILKMDPSARLSLSGILQHPWMNNIPMDEDIPDSRNNHESKCEDPPSLKKVNSTIFASLVQRLKKHAKGKH